MSKPTYIKHPFNGMMMVIAVPDSATENALTREEEWLLDYDATVRELRTKLAAREKELGEERARITTLEQFICEYGGLPNEWGKEWEPTKHGKLSSYLKSRLSAWLAAPGGEVKP